MNLGSLMCLTSAIGIIPAMAILYYVLRTYDKFLKDSNIFGFFAGGMVIGGVLLFVHIMIDPQILYFLDLALFIFVLGFATLEELIKYLILYFKKFIGGFQTTYYGLAFGLGFGATSIIALVYLDLIKNPALVVENLYTIPTAVALSVGFVGLHATTGAMIGYGSAKKVRWNYLGKAVGFHLVFNLILLWFWWSGYPARFGQAIFLAIMALVGIQYIRTEIMTTSLPKKLARKRRRDLRRKALGLPPSDSKKVKPKKKKDLEVIDGDQETSEE